jgi:hypothetical protein
LHYSSLIILLVSGTWTSYCKCWRLESGFRYPRSGWFSYCTSTDNWPEAKSSKYSIISLMHA